MSKKLTDRAGNVLGERSKRVRQAILDELLHLINDGFHPWRDINPPLVMRKVREAFSEDPQTAGRPPSVAVFYTHFGSILDALTVLVNGLLEYNMPLSDHMKLIVALEQFETNALHEKAYEIVERALGKDATS